MLDCSVRSFNSPVPKFFLIIAAKFVSPRWGFGPCFDRFPGAMPQADMWVPRRGGIALRVTLTCFLALILVFAPIPGADMLVLHSGRTRIARDVVGLGIVIRDPVPP